MLEQVIRSVVPLMADPVNVSVRQGAIEAIYTIAKKWVDCLHHYTYLIIACRLEMAFIPYIVFFVLPTLARMSDFDADVRQVASLSFALMIKLIPLDSTARTPGILVVSSPTHHSLIQSLSIVGARPAGPARARQGIPGPASRQLES